MIATYLDELERHLQGTRRWRASIRRDAADHLDDAARAHVASGLSQHDAEARAVADFGDASHLATEWNVRLADQAARRSPSVIAASGAVIGASLVLAARSRGHSGHAPISARVLFPLAMLAGQIAIASGLRVVALVLGWRRCTMPAAARRTARRSIHIAAVALVVSATALAATVLIVLATSASGVAAAAAMLVAGLAIAAFASRFSGDVTTDTDVVGSPLGWAAGGERLAALVPSHPVLACAIVIVLSAPLTAMRAESSIGVDLVWGVGQAAAIVAAYLALGRGLGLRRPAA